MKRLPGDHAGLADGAELAAPEERPGFHQERVNVQHVGDRELPAGAVAGPEKLVHALERVGERLFHQHVQPVLQGSDGHRHVQVRRRTDHAGVKAP